MALDSYASPNIIPELRQPNAAAGKITLGGLDRMAVTPSVKKRRLSMVEFPYALDWPPESPDNQYHLF
ncbi:hypothetical protein, partial [Escherichia coli]